MNRRGQTLLELVIAAGVISVSTIGALTLIVRTITVGTDSRMKTEASNYAREGVEVVRMIRDSNWLKIDQNLPDGVDGLTQWDDRTYREKRYYSFAPDDDPVQHYVLTSGSINAPVWKLSNPCGASPCATSEQRIWLKTPSGQPTYARQFCTSALCTSTTPYYRDIKISRQTETISGATIIYFNVLATVTWTSTDGSHKVTAETRLYDWK